MSFIGWIHRSLAHILDMTVSLVFTQHPREMSSRKVPALELSTLSMPGGIDDPDDPYTDFSDLSAASPAGCYPEIIVSSDFQDDPGSARSTSELIPQGTIICFNRMGWLPTAK